MVNKPPETMVNKPHQMIADKKNIIKSHLLNIKPSLFWEIYSYMCENWPEKYSWFGKTQPIAEIEEKSRIITWIKSDEKFAHLR